MLKYQEKNNKLIVGRQTFFSLLENDFLFLNLQTYMSFTLQDHTYMKGTGR